MGKAGDEPTISPGGGHGIFAFLIGDHMPVQHVLNICLICSAILLNIGASNAAMLVCMQPLHILKMHSIVTCNTQ